MTGQQSIRSKRVSRPTYRKVLSLREKEAIANKAKKAVQKEARTRVDKRKKTQLGASQSQLPSIELFDDELPLVSSVPAAMRIKAAEEFTKPLTNPPRVKLEYQLYAWVGDREVYSNDGQIVMVTFNYANLCLKTDAIACKFA